MEIVAIIVAAVGSAGLFNLIQFLIGRKDKRLQTLSAIHSDLQELKEQSCRTQMLLLMADYPDQTTELMELAQKYFVELHGDFYMSSLFAKWLKLKNLDEPIWFYKGGKKDD